MAGIGTEESILIEILCSKTNHEIHTIKNAYERSKKNDYFFMIGKNCMYI